MTNTKDIGITGSVYQTRSMEIHASGPKRPQVPGLELTMCNMFLIKHLAKNITNQRY